MQVGVVSLTHSHLVVGLLTPWEGANGATNCTKALTKDAQQNDDADNKRRRKNKAFHCNYICFCCACQEECCTAPCQQRNTLLYSPYQISRQNISSVKRIPQNLMRILAKTTQNLNKFTLRKMQVGLSRTSKQPRKATLQVRNEIRKLQQNPLLGEWRMHTALKRIGIQVSPATCGRIMAANRQLYGIEKKPPHAPRPKLELPFEASRRHEYWSCDVRYIEEHLLPDPRPVYVITIFENFARMILSSKISPGDALSQPTAQPVAGL